MNNYITKYFRDGKEHVVYIYATTLERAKDQFYYNFLGATLISMEKSK